MNLGGFSISVELYDYLVKNFKTVLELGSGAGTEALSSQINIISIEHDKKYLNMYNSTYIYAPIKNRWYNPEYLQEIKGMAYDALLIDGPPGYIGRSGILNHLDLFNTEVPIIIDDCQRSAEKTLAIELQRKLQRTAKFIECEDGKIFSIV